MKRKTAKTTKRRDQISAFILTGGASSRMGKAKALLEFVGEPLILRIARMIEPLVSSVIAVGPSERYAPLGLPVIEDQPFGIAGERGRSPGPL